MNSKFKKTSAVLLALLLVLTSFGFAFAEPAGTSRGQYKNVIFFIGDGMGENHLKLALQEGYTLFMEDNADNRGQSETRSFSHSVTDSAAGATALACGVRNINGCVGTYFFDPFGFIVRPRSLTERAIAEGMRTGIVTTDATTGATPAGFSTHTLSRKSGGKITDQQLDSEIDLIWGAKANEADKETAEANGFAYVTTKKEMETLTAGVQSFGQFSADTWRLKVPKGDPSPTLVQMTEKAIELLDGDNGFFLMVEGGHIDKNSHRTENGVDFPEKRRDAAEAVKGFDNAIKAAVDFARADGETLVLVTADHETGDLRFDDGEYRYHSGSHSGANVPLIVYCCTDFVEEGSAVPNTYIPKKVAEKLGWDENVFPKTDIGAFFAGIKKWFVKN